MIDKFLIFTQRFTKTDNIYLARSGFWIALATIVANVLGMVLAVSFARLSTKEVFGQYQGILALIDTFLILSFPAINTALMEAVAKGNEGSVWLALKKRFTYSFLGSLVFLLLAIYAHYFYGDLMLTLALFAVAIFFPVYIISNTIFSYYYAKKQIRFPQIYQILIRLLVVGGLVGAIIFWNNVFAIVTAFLLLNGLMNLILLWYFKKTAKTTGGSDTNIVKYGWKLTGANLIPEFLNNFDKLAISFFLGAEPLAIYTIAEKIPNAIKGFFKSFSAIFFPKLVFLNKNNFLNKFKNIYLYLAFVAIAVLTVLFLPIVIPLLFGPNYQDSIFIGQLCVLIIFPFIFHHLISDWLQAQKKARYYFYLTLVYSLGSAFLIYLFLFFNKSLISVVAARIIIAFISFFVGLTLVKKS